MKKYFQYAWYVFRHIYYVQKACFHFGLYWQGLIHDWTKWLPSEFVPYTNKFYGPKDNQGIHTGRDVSGYYDATEVADEKFKYAWFLHQKRHPHHWEWWVMPKKDGTVKIMKMKERYAMEMLCDWWGASMAQGHGGTVRDWYTKNKENMLLHEDTRLFIECCYWNGKLPERGDKWPWYKTDWI